MQKSKKTFFVCTSASCRERMFDCQKISDYLKANDWALALEIKEADLLVINTCSFNNEEDDSSTELLAHYSSRIKKGAKIIVCGCMPAINPQKLEGVEIFATITPTNLGFLDSIIGGSIGFDKIKDPVTISRKEVSYRPVLKKMLSVKTAFFKFRANFEIKISFFLKLLRYLKKEIKFMRLLKASINPFVLSEADNFFYIRISNGCLGYCTYCAKKIATGTLRSKVLSDVLDEFKSKRTSPGGVFYLISEDSGCYGADIGTNIAELLKEIFYAGNGFNFKLAITNFNAHWFKRYYPQIKEGLVNNRDKILYLQVPIQSGSNKVLQLMNRPYRIEEIEEYIVDLKKSAPGLAITTDIIVGFPGESENDFEDTKNFLSRVRFNYADIFAYAPRNNSRSFNMSGEIPDKVIERRRAELLRLQSKNYSTRVLFKKASELSKGFK